MTCTVRPVFGDGAMKKLLILGLWIVSSLNAGDKKATISGKILSIEEDYCNKSIDYVLHAVLAVNGKEARNLVLAPKWYLHAHQIDLKIGTEIQATVLQQPDGSALVLQLKIAGKTFSLRDAKGRPLWKAEPGSEDLFKTICKAAAPSPGG